MKVRYLALLVSLMLWCIASGAQPAERDPFVLFRRVVDNQKENRMLERKKAA